MKLQIQLENVVAAKENFYFIALQLQFDDKVTPIQKFRTELSPSTNRPAFKRNLFSFYDLIELQKLKIGLMVCQNASQTSLSTAKMIGSASLSLSDDRLKNLPPEGNRQILHFLNKDKDVGQLECVFRYRAKPQQSKNDKDSTTDSKVEFNPLISRILFTEQSAKDEVRTESSLAQLEKQMTFLYKSYSSVRKQEESLENLLMTLSKDGEQIKSDIEAYQKINEKIAAKISQKEHLQSLRLEIDMLKSTEQGRRLLLERLEYFEERVLAQRDQYQKLAERYDQLKGEIDRRIKSVEDYASRLRGKEMQEFQLQRNEDILKRYEQIYYEFSCNQQIINSLAKKSSKSDLTAEQASLLLSQVNYHIQLEEVSAGKAQEEGILKMIEGEAKVMGKYEQQGIPEEERLVLQIKLNAIQEQISNIRSKIKRALPKNRAFIESQVFQL